VEAEHAVGEVHAAAPAPVEDVRVGAAARQPVARLEAATLERRRRERDGRLVALQPVAVVALAQRRLDVALVSVAANENASSISCTTSPSVASS
jgi:hypothetical protein